eukprot:scaffold301_cov393-Prasinococcus_capsulatus_cf.AAC.7
MRRLGGTALATLCPRPYVYSPVACPRKLHLQNQLDPSCRRPSDPQCLRRQGSSPGHAGQDVKRTGPSYSEEVAVWTSFVPPNAADLVQWASRHRPGWHSTKTRQSVGLWRSGVPGAGGR